ncbi:MAG: MFS transporter [Leptospirillum sp.]
MGDSPKIQIPSETKSSRTIILILSANRFLRGIAQGFLIVWFLPDLHLLGWSPVDAGIALSSGLLFDFLLTLAIGRIADRQRGIPILVSGEILTMTPCLFFLWNHHPVWIWIAAALSGLGQRSNGSPGPFTPAEQTTILKSIDIGRLFSIVSSNLAAGLSGMAIGGLSGAILPHGAGSLPLENLRGLLLLMIASSLLNLFLLLKASRFEEIKPKSQSANPGYSPLLPGEKKNLLLLATSNALFGLSMGITDPSISYWFMLRFHMGPQTISLVLGISFLAAALFSALLARKHHHSHLLRATVLLQFLAVISLFLMPLPSSFGWACALFTLRFACLRGPGGIRQALAGQLVRAEHAGWAQSIHLSSLGVAAVFGPALAGLFWKKGMVNAPLFMGAAFGVISLILFLILYRTSVMTPPSPSPHRP